MKKIAVSITISVLLSILLIGVVCADGVTPRADEVFSSASAYLYSNKDLKISCATYAPHDIRITSCWYDIKVDGDWEYGGAISVSSSSVSGSCLLGTQFSCASYFGTGTYRVGFTVDADGHSITRYSNERTY